MLFYIIAQASSDPDRVRPPLPKGQSDSGATRCYVPSIPTDTSVPTRWVYSPYWRTDYTGMYWRETGCPLPPFLRAFTARGAPPAPPAPRASAAAGAGAGAGAEHQTRTKRLPPLLPLSSLGPELRVRDGRGFSQSEETGLTDEHTTPSPAREQGDKMRAGSARVKVE